MNKPGLGTRALRARCYTWTTGRAAATAAPGSPNFFLTERYLLFAAGGAGQLFFRGVQHAPYRICSPSVSEISIEPARLPGFRLDGEPASVVAALPLNVSIFPLVPCLDHPHDSN